MKRFSLLAFTVILIITSVNATVRRVGYFGPPIANVDYATFAAAYTAAVSGDTIYVFPGITGINQTFTKKLILIGNGDLLDSSTYNPKGNVNMQANKGIATVSAITFSTGSDGSVVTGFVGGTYDIRVSNITITRNRECTVYLTTNSVTYTNPQIVGNYRIAIYNNNVNASNVSNILISNNFIYALTTQPGNIYSGNISNNVWAYDNTLNQSINGGSTSLSNTAAIELGGGAYLVQNNIFASYTSTNANNNYNYFTFNNGGNSVFNYNLGVESTVPINFGAGTGNIITQLVNVPSIFAGFPNPSGNSTDGRYKLGASSPAATMAPGNKPIGMYGGNTPYKQSLIPAIPSVYKLTSAQGNNPSGSTITISISTRGNN